MKFLKLVDSITIGINLWLIPQISEHWPKNSPGRFINNIDWLSRPGVESILIPRDGTVHAWITSIDVVKIRILNCRGKIHRLSTSSRRNSLIFSWLVWIIKESNFILWKSEYSYLQYHWCPIDLIDNFLWLISSVKYKIFKDGIAIKIKIIIGKIVQISSIEWPFKRNRLINLLFINNKKIDRINIVIRMIIIIAISWKKIIKS